MLLSKDRIGGVLILFFCGAYGVLTRDITLLPFQEDVAFNARTMPEILTVLAVVLSVIVIFFQSSQEKPQLKGYNWVTCISFLVLMSLYGFTIRPLGFIISTSLFLMCGYVLLGERNVIKLFLAAVPLVVAFWALMALGLEVYIAPFPEKFSFLDFIKS